MSDHSTRPVVESAPSWSWRILLALVLSVLLLGATHLGGTPKAAAAAPTSTTTTTIPTGVTHTPGSPAISLVESPPWTMRGCGISLHAPKAPATKYPVGHCRILEVGDSVGNNLGWGLANQLLGTPGITLIQKDRPSTGLSNSWFYNWDYHVRLYLNQYHPHLLIVCLGANDEQNVVIKGHVVTFATKPWRIFYRSQIAKIAADAARLGVHVLWVGMPVVRGYSYAQGMAMLNSLYASSSTTVRGTTFLPTWPLLATKAGAFRPYGAVNHHWVVLRSPDGVHLSYDGEQVFATYAAQQISIIYHITLKAKHPAIITG